jgi:hypothetical protein
MRKFQIKFTVNAELLPTIISLLTPEIGSLEVAEVEKNSAAMPKTYIPKTHIPKTMVVNNDVLRKSVPRQPHRLPIQEQIVGKIVLGVFADGHVHAKNEVKQALENAGYSPISDSPTIHRLNVGGFIEPGNLRGTWKLKKKDKE